MATTGHETEAINVQGLKASLKKGGNVGIYNEATCSTAGGTAAKVTNTTPPSFTLTAGAKILVKFTYAISAENATLQVGTNAAKPIFYHGAALAANLVKAGTSLLLAYDGTNFNVVGDINTDTTYQVMGASGASHASGLVPDTPSTAGTTKYLREDGTWQEPAGQNYSAGDGIDISNNEISADNTIARKTDLAPAKLGSGIGTCSTSSGTALEVTLSDYNLVQNGFVAVTFSNDVPANATLNVNSKGAKPIIYKGSAITADTIKADDTVMFCYNGSQYVVTSLGGGGGSVVYPEFVTISLTQSGGSDSDLIGATVVVTNDDTSAVILSTTWQGSGIAVQVDAGVDYTVTVGNVSSLVIRQNTQSYTAVSGLSRIITFSYFGNVVDLGLPSGTLWATGNLVKNNTTYSIGAETDWGTYVSWGNIDGHNEGEGYDFSEANYNTTPGYSVNGDIPSNDLQHDICRARLGDPWRLPTKDNFQELCDNTDIEWVANYNNTGVAGRKFMKKSDHSVFVFFPASGNYNNTNLNYRGTVGYYWSTRWYSAKAYILAFTNSYVDPQDNYDRRFGFSVRPVM